MTENKFYTCRYDRTFKEVFMKEENKDLLIYLLEKILKVKINDLEYLNLEQNVDNIYVKRKHFDLNLKTDVGKIQVEINSINKGYVRPRNMAYICDTYSHHTLKGQNYNEDTKIIQINFSYQLNHDDLVRIYYAQDSKQNRYVSNFIIYELNMDKYMNFWYTKDENQIQENKGIIMLDLPLDDLVDLSKDDRMVKKYMEEVKRVNEDPEFHEYMSAEQDNQMIENSLLREATEEGIKQGIKEGMKQGIKEGVKQGKQQGIKQGIQQGQDEIILNMSQKGLTPSEISSFTGIDIDYINECLK